MSRPPLDSTPIVKNVTNVKTSQLEPTHIGKKTIEPTPLTRPMEFSKPKGKAHIPEEPESDPKSSDSLSSESDSSDDSNYSKSKSKGRNKKKSVGNA